MRNLAFAFVLVTMLLFGMATPAAATWSIVAVDDETGEVGVAMAACASAAALGDEDQVLAPIVVVPNRGAGVVQGIVRAPAITEMRSLLSVPDVDAPTVVDTLVAVDDEQLQAVRQYGVVLLGDSANPGSYSGLDAEPAAAAQTATGVSVQGVGLVDALVIDRTLTAFTAGREGGAELDEALVAALVAGSEAGGDTGCDRQTALFAQLAVSHPADNSGLSPSTLLTVTVDEEDGQNPVTILADAFNRGDRGWIDAGRRPPTLLPKWLVLSFGLVLAAAAVIVLRRGMRMG